MSNYICKAKYFRTGEWLVGYYMQVKDWLYDKPMHLIFVKDEAESYPRCEFIGWYEVHPNTVCRYTGLDDKNNKQIFEHDLVRTEFGRICEVVWVTYPSYVGWDLIPVAQFDSPPPTKTSLFLSRNLEVVNNIFDQEMQYNE